MVVIDGVDVDDDAQVEEKERAVKTEPLLPQQQQKPQSQRSLAEYPLPDDDDEGISYIELPSPGLPLSNLTSATDASIASSTTLPSSQFALVPSEPATRLVPSVCAICLSHYQLGDEVVWSSNPACEHAFHFTCVERWLSKQRDCPLCPCCRREFVIDPYDVQEEDEDAEEVEDGGGELDVYLSEEPTT
jgi:hypothetical protein